MFETLGKTSAKLYYASGSKNVRIQFKKGNLHDVAPGKMLDKGVYVNRNGHLPEEFGRVWYEADINYSGGYRGSCRILYSNDGLVFVTYDHYETFVEIV